MDVDTMVSISRQMSLLANTLDFDVAANRRAAAQSLALALALDPSNRGARDLLSDLAQDKTPSSPDPAEVDRARTRVWDILPWLESSEAGQDGQALAACLTDALVLLDPANPKSQANKEKGDSGQWADWVPALASYEPQVITKLPDENPSAMPISPTDGSNPAIKRKTAEVWTPLWTYEQGMDKSRIRPLAISMKAWIESGENERHGFDIRLENTEEKGTFHQTSRDAIAALKVMGDQLPDNGLASLSVGKGVDYLALKNGRSISAAAAVLVDAAVSGREPHATVMGIVSEDGSLRMPTRAWDKLRSLSGGSGGRLVLPREAEAMLPAILAVEDPAFFMKFEVILADNVKQLVEFSAKDGKNDVTDASVKFAEIRDKMGSTAVSLYVANRFIRQRLGEIAQASPKHASARMLFIQGGGDRPTRLPKQILASEIRRALEPMAVLPSDDIDSIDIALIDTTNDKCHALLDPLERYVDIGDRDFFGKAKELLILLKTFSRVKRASRDYDFNSGGGKRPNPYEAYRAVKAAYSNLRTELAVVANDDEKRDLPRDDQRNQFSDRMKGSK